MAEPRKPQDRRPAAGKDEGVFEFEHDGNTYTFRDVFGTITPGFVRKNRKLDPMDMFFTMLEALADEETLAVIDSMDRDSFERLNNELNEFLGATPGE